MVKMQILQPNLVKKCLLNLNLHSTLVQTNWNSMNREDFFYKKDKRTELSASIVIENLAKIDCKSLVISDVSCLVSLFFF